jgi:hypothetical protein
VAAVLDQAALQINRGREVIGFGLERSRMGE